MVDRGVFETARSATPALRLEALPLATPTLDDSEPALALLGHGLLSVC
jgi:hypothetical protein